MIRVLTLPECKNTMLDKMTSERVTTWPNLPGQPSFIPAVPRQLFSASPSTLKSVPRIINSNAALYIRFFPGLNFSYAKLNLTIFQMTEAT